MLPYATAAEAEAALGRAMTSAEALWFRYTAAMPDYYIYCHNILFLFVVFTLAPLPVALLELRAPGAVAPYKLQPRVRLSPAAFLCCYKDVMRIFFLVVGPLQLVSYPAVKMVGIHTGLPLPSLGEIAAHLLVYFLVEGYLNYWIHWLLHGSGATRRSTVCTMSSPRPLASPHHTHTDLRCSYLPSPPSFGQPLHQATFWLWIVLRQMEAIETHSGSTLASA